MSKNNALCSLVGAGCGDEELLSIAAARRIKSAEVVIFDRLVHPNILNLAPNNCELINAGKRAGKHKLRQEEINELLVQKTKLAKRVVRLKGGDPMLFGRGGEEIEALEKAGLRYEIIPGISSALAAPTCAGVWPTHRQHNSILTIFTGHKDPKKDDDFHELASVAKSDGVKIMLMGNKKFPQIAKKLLQHGEKPETQVALIRNGAHKDQERIFTSIGEIAAAKKSPLSSQLKPVIAVIGCDPEEAKKYGKWFSDKELFGKKILVTRTRRQASGIGVNLRKFGADVIELPLIRVRKLDRESDGELKLEIEEVTRDAHSYNWLVFTSPNAVFAFFTKFREFYHDARSLGLARIASVGIGTSRAIIQCGYAIDLQAEGEYSADALVRTFKKNENIENLTILWPRAKKANKDFIKKLEALGAIVDAVPFYETLPPKTCNPLAIEMLDDGEIDMISFASSSAVRNFAALGVKVPSKTALVSIGKKTSATLQELFGRVDLTASKSDVEIFADEMRKFFQK